MYTIANIINVNVRKWIKALDLPSGKKKTDIHGAPVKISRTEKYDS